MSDAELKRLAADLTAKPDLSAEFDAALAACTGPEDLCGWLGRHGYVISLAGLAASRELSDTALDAVAGGGDWTSDFRGRLISMMLRHDVGTIDQRWSMDGPPRP